MKQMTLIALFVSALMVGPSMAAAKHHKNGEKPYQEKQFYNGGQKKQFQNNRKQWSKSQNHNDGYGHENEYKDSKSRKFKRILKKSLKAFGAMALDNLESKHRHHYNDHDDNYDRKGKYYNACLPRHVVRTRLIKSGWHDSQIINNGGDYLRMNATNYKGRRYQLLVDACNGAVVKRTSLGRFWGNY